MKWPIWKFVVLGAVAGAVTTLVITVANERAPELYLMVGDALFRGAFSGAIFFLVLVLVCKFIAWTK